MIVDGSAATSSRLSSPNGVESDGAGGFWIANSLSNTIVRVDSAGLIRTIVGLPISYSGCSNGPAYLARFNSPQMAFPDPVSGNDLILDWSCHAVRMLLPNGTVSAVTWAGVLSSSGSTGNGGPASQGRFTFPAAFALDGAGGGFVAVRLCTASEGHELVCSVLS